MAKKIRFPLQMNGVEVRTIEELRENFDLESVLGYFTNGKLVTWLKDRYYDDEAMAVEALSADDTDLNQKLMSILDVAADTEIEEIDMEVIQRRNEKLLLLRQITDDKNIIDKVDCVAFNQDDLLDILDEGVKEIYLCQGNFEIPLSARNITYYGLENPSVSLRKTKTASISSSNIKFVGITISGDLGDLNNSDSNGNLCTKDDECCSDCHENKQATKVAPKSIEEIEEGYSQMVSILVSLMQLFEQGYSIRELKSLNETDGIHGTINLCDGTDFPDYRTIDEVIEYVPNELILCYKHLYGVEMNHNNADEPVQHSGLMWKLKAEEKYSEMVCLLLALKELFEQGYSIEELKSLNDTKKICNFSNSSRFPDSRTINKCIEVVVSNAV